MRLFDEPTDYRTACVKAASVTLASRFSDEYTWWFKRTKMCWSVEPSRPNPSEADLCWLASISYERYPDPPHMMLHHLMKGALASFLFDRNLPSAAASSCFLKYDKERIPSEMRFTAIERLVAEKTPGWPEPEQYDWWSAYRSFRGSELKIITEAKQGKFRLSSDKHNFDW